MELPREVLDQIVGEFIIQKGIAEIDSQHLLKAWRDFIESDNVTPANMDENDYAWPLVHIDLDVENLSKLRLVSRSWNSSVSRLLHKDLWWNIDFDQADCLENIGKCCDNANGHFPVLTRKLCLAGTGDLNSFMRQYSFEPEKFEGQDVDNNYIMLNSAYSDTLTRRRTQPDDRMVHYDKTKEHAVLRSLFDRLVEIECFIVSFPVIHSEIEYRTDCYDMKGVGDMIATLQYGLSCPAFQHLKDLSLLVPSTWHIGQLAGSLSQEARDRLIRLRLVIQDATGPCGDLDRCYYDESNDGDHTIFIDTSHVPSNLQIAYPNRQHQNALWALVASCRNLESLAIHATHYLGLNQLKWDRPAGFRGLDLSSVARRVQLDDVKIYGDGGSWDTFFDFLRDRCPDLDLLVICELTYFSNHERHEPNSRLWENRRNIWTNAEEDDESLLRLEEHMGRPEGSESDFDTGWTIWKRFG